MNNHKDYYVMIDAVDFTSYLTVKRGIAKSTIRGLISNLNNFLWWCKEHQKQLSKQAVEEFIFDRQSIVSEGTINAYIYLFRTLDEFFEDREIHLVLSKGIKKRRIEKKPVKILSENEVSRLLSTSIEDTQQRDIFAKKEKNYLLLTKFLYYTCARFEEAAQIKVNAIDFGGGWITFTHTKSKRPRSVPLTEPLASELWEFTRGKRQDEYIFVNRIGNVIDISNFWQDLRKRASLAGIAEEVHPHMLRATGASHMAIHGAKIDAISEILGHADVATTYKHYIHFQKDDMKDALNKNPLILKYAKKTERIKQFKQFLEGFGFKEDPELKTLHQDILGLLTSYN